MRLRLLALLLIALPGFGLGQGLSVRVCLERVLGSVSGAEGCCAVQSEPSCCAQGDLAPRLVDDDFGACESCCFDIDTSSEPPAPSPERQSEDVKVAQSLHLADHVQAFGALASSAPRPRCAAPPPLAAASRAKPLPLRI